MHLLVIMGFLGTGKTTLLLRLAEQAQSQNRKTAILVNEVGEIGIDNQLMRQLGFNVWELLGGCICCSLAGDVTGTLNLLHREYQPDLVLLEPTGAADPRNLIQVLDHYDGPPFESVIKVALIDPLRMDMLMTVAEPLVTAALKQADLVLITKADAATPQEMDFALETARTEAPDRPIFTINAREALAPEVMEKLLPWIISD